MNRFPHSTGVAKLVWIAGASALIALVLVAWPMFRVDHLAVGSARRTFSIAIDFDEFRQIMVRKNPTQAIIARSGMTVVEEQILDLDIDTSNDKRPVLNALLGRSKSSVNAKKLLTVKLEDPELEAPQLTLTQHAEVKPKELHVRTQANGPTGKLNSYLATLDAQPDGALTKVSLAINHEVRLQLPFFMTATATKKVQAAADAAAQEQEQSLKDFIAEFTEEPLVMSH